MSHTIVYYVPLYESIKFAGKEHTNNFAQLERLQGVLLQLHGGPDAASLQATAADTHGTAVLPTPYYL